MNLVKMLILTLMSIQIMLVKCQFNMPKYFQMPPLYQFADFDKCLYGTLEKTKFCYVISEIIPNKSIPLWNDIEAFSSDNKRHYEHGTLINGVCLNDCNFIQNLTEIEQQNLYGGKLTNPQINYHINAAFEEFFPDRLAHNKLINQCLNYNFSQKYNLKLRSNIEHCVSNKDPLQFDSYDVAFGLVVGFFLTLITLSSLYDLRLKRQLPINLQNNQHYVSQISGKRQSLFLIGSICRNYYRLVNATANPTEITRDLRFLEAFRFFMMFGVIMNHTILGINATGVQNPYFLEKIYHRLEKTILANGTLIMQTFFSMSGFLLTILCTNEIQKIKEKDRNYIQLFIKFIILRFVRLTPIYAVGILLAASSFSKFGEGPFWLHGVQPEKIFCRKHWWTNLLYVNNYLYPEEQCMPQTWYLGVDFQLFVMSLGMLLFTLKYPKTTYLVLTLAMFISIISTTLTAYMIDFNGIFFPTVEMWRYAATFDTFFKYFFVPAHTNMGGYICGVTAGKIYIYLKKINYKLADNKKYVFYWYMQVPLGFLVILSAEVFYIYDFQNITIWTAIYLGLSRNLYAVISTYVILGMAFKVGWIGYEFSSLSIFRIPGRLTYCAFVIHTFLIRLPLQEYYQPVHFGIISTVTNIIAKLVLSYILAFMLAILVELPVSAFIRVMFLGPKKSRKIPQETLEVLHKTETIAA